MIDPKQLLDRAFQLAFIVAYRLNLAWNFVFRPESHGVWVAVWFQGELLVIRNTYRSSITLPGGGVRRGETNVAGALRELAEEVGIHPRPEDLKLWGQYLSQAEYKKDCVSLYEIEMAVHPQIQADNREVAWAEFHVPVQILEMELAPIVRTYLHDKRAGQARVNR